MRYRKFGNTDLLVSEIGFGAWAIGGNSMVGNTPIGWGIANDDDSVAAIKMSLEKGINFFDTADFYGLGHSESLLGKELSREKGVILATKVGHRAIDNNIVVDYSKDYILSACEASLGRLKRDYIDYYQLHTARMKHLEEGECIEAMELLQAQGKIRYYGLSLNTFYPGPEAEFMMANHYGDGFQLVYNIINQRARPLIATAASNHYGIIARMPLQFGLLTGKIGKETVFAPDDHRSFRFNPDIVNQSLDALEAVVWPLCVKYAINKTSLALSFILSYEEISTVIPGIRTERHAAENTQGIVQLSLEDIGLLETAYNKYFSEVVDKMELQG